MYFRFRKGNFQFAKGEGKRWKLSFLSTVNNFRATFRSPRYSFIASYDAKNELKGNHEPRCLLTRASNISSLCLIQQTQNVRILLLTRTVLLLYFLRWLTTVFRDLVALATVACLAPVFVARAKMNQVTSRNNKKHFSSWKALNLFGICSNSFKLCSNMYSSLGRKKYGKKVW